MSETEPLRGIDDIWAILNSSPAAVRSYLLNQEGVLWPSQAINALCEVIAHFHTLYCIQAHGIPPDEVERFKTTCARLNKLAPRHFPCLARWPYVIRGGADDKPPRAIVIDMTLLTGPFPNESRVLYLQQAHHLLARLYGFLRGGGQVMECDWCGNLAERRRTNHRFCNNVCRAHYSNHRRAGEVANDEVAAAN